MEISISTWLFHPILCKDRCNPFFPRSAWKARGGRSAQRDAAWQLQRRLGRGYKRLHDAVAAVAPRPNGLCLVLTQARGNTRGEEYNAAPLHNPGAAHRLAALALLSAYHPRQPQHLYGACVELPGSFGGGLMGA